MRGTPANNPRQHVSYAEWQRERLIRVEGG